MCVYVCVYFLNYVFTFVQDMETLRREGKGELGESIGAIRLSKKVEKLVAKLEKNIVSDDSDKK